MIKNCLVCSKEFKTYPSRVKKYRGKFCSHKCYYKSLIKGRTNNRNYILIRMPEHPYANSKGYIFEHRFVAEKYLGRFLFQEEVIHHIKG